MMPQHAGARWILLTLLTVLAGCARGHTVVQIDGTDIQVTSLRQHGWRPQFVMGDKKIAYWWGEPLLMDVKTRQVSRIDRGGLTKDWDYVNLPVTYSEDGQRIFGFRQLGAGGLLVADLARSRVEPAPLRKSGGQDGQSIRQAWVSRDSSKVVWISHAGATERASSDICVGVLGGEAVETLARYVDPLHPGAPVAWSPDGGRIAFALSNTQAKPSLDPSTRTEADVHREVMSLLPQLWTADLQTGKLSHADGEMGYFPAFLGPKSVVVSSIDGRICVWSLATQRMIATELKTVSGGGFAGSQDGDALVFTTGTTEEPVLNLATGFRPLASSE